MKKLLLLFLFVCFGAEAQIFTVNQINATAPISSASNVAPFTYGVLTYTDTNNVQVLQGNANSYVQALLQNTNGGSTASADYVVSNNLGTTSTYYADFGINSSTYAGSGSFNLSNASYLTATSGDLSIGTTTSNAIHFAVNSGAYDALTISATNNITMPSGGTFGYGTFLVDAISNISAAGSTQGTATTITTSQVNITSGTALQGVILPASPVIGQKVGVTNNSGNNLYVYPQVGATIDGTSGGTVNSPITIGARDTLEVVYFATNTWYTVVDNLYGGTGIAITHGVGGEFIGLTATTGTGSSVLQTSPTLISPVLGSASATSMTFNGSPAGPNLVLNSSSAGAAVVIAQANVTLPATDTSSALIYNSTPSTAASAFTLTTLNNFNADIGTIGAGSAITNINAFNVAATFVGGGTVKGFNSSLATNTNTWNLYMNGTAHNYMNGALLLGSTTDTGNAQLQITGSESHTKAELDLSIVVSTPTTGQTVTLASGVETEIINPAGTLATLTVTLPACAAANNGGIARFSTSQILTALTVNATAGSVSNAPTTATAGQGYGFICSGGATTWYRLY